MEPTNSRQMLLEARFDEAGKHGRPILAALAIADEDRAPIEVDVLHP